MSKPLYQMLACVLTATCLTMPAMAQTQPAHHPAHEYSMKKERAQPELNHGKRWATDTSLREGMIRVRTAAIKAQKLSVDGKLNRAQATTLATSIDNALAYIFEHCKLEPDADANLHLLIERLMHAASTVKTAPDSMEGLPEIMEVLEAYPYYFDHPDWQSLRDKH